MSLVLLPLNTSAQQSRLEQEIVAPDCSQPEDCTLKPPSIFVISKNGGRPVFSGTFDATFTRTLRVFFGGNIYRLGVNSELTVINGKWKFDLSRLMPSIEPGGYAFTIEAVGYDGTVKQAARTVIFLQSDIDTPPVDIEYGQSPGSPIVPEGDIDQPVQDEGEKPPVVEEDAAPRPDVPHETIDEIRNACVIIALLVLGIGLWLLYWVARRRTDSS